MKIIDFERFGNSVRFYLGEDSLDQWWGDDWNDTPYECNAESVYAEYVAGYRDVTFDADYVVLEPCCGVHNSAWSKKDMIERRVPCIAVKKFPAPQTAAEALYQRTWDCDNFDRLIADDEAVLYYFGDEMEPDVTFTDEGAITHTSDTRAEDDSIVKFDGQCLLELYSDERASCFLIMVDEETFGLLTSRSKEKLRCFAPSPYSADGEWLRDEDFIVATLDNIRDYAKSEALDDTKVYVRLVSPMILDV